MYGGILGLVRFDINHMVHLTSSLEMFYLDKISVTILTIPFSIKWSRLSRESPDKLARAKTTSWIIS